jgi:hypothetical protein
MTVARKPGHRGERGISRKPLRRESRSASADLYARVRFSTCFCTRDRGCSAHPVFPAPSSCFEGGHRRKARAHSAPRERGRTSARCLIFESCAMPSLTMIKTRTSRFRSDVGVHHRARFARVLAFAIKPGSRRSGRSLAARSRFPRAGAAGCRRDRRQGAFLPSAETSLPSRHRSSDS